jgi:oxaloacetate decarboxylase gamma subunit
MEVNLIVEGLKFMTIGMSVVFVFLAMLVWVINIQAKIVNKFFPEPPKPVKKVPPKTDDDEEIVAAIIGAITAYRNK